MAELTARRDSLLDYLPGNWQQAINTNPLLNALGRAMNRPTSDLGELAMREYGTPEQKAAADQEWLLQKMRGPSWLERQNPVVQDGVNKLGVLANFVGPGVKLPAATPKPTGIRAYHGSPHDFDRFDMSKIGTGEGAQAYGRGLYFAENEAVARAYRDRLTVQRDPGLLTTDPDTLAMRALLDSASGTRRSPDEAIEWLKGHEAYLRANSPDDWWKKKGIQSFNEMADAYKAAQDRVASGLISPSGRMYEVNIKADPEQFLDWDKPLSQQPNARAILERIRVNTAPEAPHDNPAVNNIRAGLAQANMRRDEWQDALKRPETVEALRDAGIPGIKYLDQGSRTAGQGSRNFVVFDDKLIEILRKYGLLPPVAAGTAAALNQQEPQQ